MKVVVQEKVNKIITPEQKIFNVVVDLLISRNTIPENIGLMKGDLIVYRGAGDPVRFSAGNAAGKTMLTDPTSETGWVLGNASEGTGATVTLRNISGEMISAGTIVKISTGTNFVKAEKGDTVSLFVVSENCEDDTEVSCYAVSNTVCLVRCTSGAVNVGARLTISSTDGLCESTTDVSDRLVGIALTAKDNTSIGVVKALLLEIGRMEHTGDTMTGDLDIDGNNAHIAIQSEIDEDVTPAETLSAKPVVWYDKDGNMIGHIALEQSTNNRLSLKLGVRRLIGNTWTWKQIRFHVETDGNTNLETDGLYNPVEQQYATVNTTSGTDTIVGSFTLTKGTYIVTLSVSWNANNNGHRRMHVSNFGHISYVSQRAASDLRTYLTKTLTINVASSTTYDIYALQNSGSKLECLAVSLITKIA